MKHTSLALLRFDKINQTDLHYHGADKVNDMDDEDEVPRVSSLGMFRKCRSCCVVEIPSTVRREECIFLPFYIL